MPLISKRSSYYNVLLKGSSSGSDSDEDLEEEKVAKFEENLEEDLSPSPFEMSITLKTHNILKHSIDEILAKSQVYQPAKT